MHGETPEGRRADWQAHRPSGRAVVRGYYLTTVIRFAAGGAIGEDAEEFFVR